MADGDFNWLDYARAINEWNQARQNKKNQGFKQAPMSPEQRAVWQYAFDKTKALPDVNNDLYPTARYYGTTGTSIDVDALKAGKTGYKPVPPPTPAQLSAIIGGKSAAPAATGNEDTKAPAGGASVGGAQRQPYNRIGGDTGDDTIYGAITRDNPRVSSGAFYGGELPTSTGATAGLSPSTPDGSAFKEFLSTYGRAAAMAVLAIMTSNPGMAFGAAVQAWRAHQAQGQTPPAGGGGTAWGN